MGDGLITVADHTAYYTEPFICHENYDYVQIYVSSIKGDSVYFVLQEYKYNEWIPRLKEPGSEIFVNDELKSNIYLMYCGRDATNYATPFGADTKKVLSVSTNSTYSYAIQANHKYRIMIYNPDQWNGGNSEIRATLQVKNL